MVAAEPADRLLLQGFVDVPRLNDIDGDGFPELVVGSLRPDLIGTISAGGSGSVDAQLNVFKNTFAADGGRFARPVAMVEQIGLTGDILKSRVRDRVLATFFQDVNGDGIRDFWQRTQMDHVLVRAVSKEETRYALGDVLWEMHIDPDALTMLVDESSHAAVIAIEEEQVIYAEFR